MDAAILIPPQSAHQEAAFLKLYKDQDEEQVNQWRMDGYRMIARGQVAVISLAGAWK
jgi:hypothetical protein